MSPVRVWNDLRCSERGGSRTVLRALFAKAVEFDQGPVARRGSVTTAVSCVAFLLYPLEPHRPSCQYYRACRQSSESTYQYLSDESAVCRLPGSREAGARRAR